MTRHALTSQAEAPSPAAEAAAAAEAARLAATQEGDKILADSATSLPLAAVPNVLLTLEKIGGPTSINPSEGPFWNLQEWGLVAN